MQTEPYVVLRPFMVEESGLKGSELVACAPMAATCEGVLVLG